MVRITFKLSITVGEEFEIWWPQMARNALILSTMVGENFEICWPQMVRNARKLEKNLKFACFKCLKMVVPSWIDLDECHWEDECTRTFVIMTCARSAAHWDIRCTRIRRYKVLHAVHAAYIYPARPRSRPILPYSADWTSPYYNNIWDW